MIKILIADDQELSDPEALYEETSMLRIFR